MKRYAWVALLYFAQGLPAGVVTKTMPVLFTARGVDLASIGLLSLVGLPWTFKFLWAPIIDRFGARRHWIAGCLAAIALLIFSFPSAFAGIGPGNVPIAVWCVLLAVVFFSATQDVAIDAGTIEMLDKKQLGPANGIRVTAYRVALILAGGLLVSLAAGFGEGRWEGLGWSATWAVTGSVFLALAGAALFFPRAARPLEEMRHQPLGTVFLRIAAPLAVSAVVWYLLGESGSAFLTKYQTPFAVLAGVGVCLVTAFRGSSRQGPEPLRDLLGKPGALVVVFFILTFKLGDSSMAPMTTPFLARGAGFSPAEIGILLNTFGVLGTILGAMLGGYLTFRWGVFRALWILGLFQAVSNLGYAYVAGSPQKEIVWTAALVEAFCGGLGTAPFLAFLMTICSKGEAATQYAFLSAIYLLSISIAGAFSGYLAEPMGFQNYFFLTFFLALPAFALLPIVKKWISDTAPD